MDFQPNSLRGIEGPVLIPHSLPKTRGEVESKPIPVPSETVDISGKVQKEGQVLTPEQASSLKQAIAKQGAGEIASVAAPVDERVLINGNLSGTVGKTHANFSLRQSENYSNVDGWIGGRSMHVNEWKRGSSSNISGNVSSNSGYQNVNLWANGEEGSRYVSGTVGNKHLNLHETSSGNRLSVSGWIDRGYAQLVYRNQDGRIAVDGLVRDQNGHYSEIRLWGSQNPDKPAASYLSFIPLLVVAGDY